MKGRNDLLLCLTKAFRDQGKIERDQELEVHRSLTFYKIDELDLVEITMLVEECIGRHNFYEDESVAQCKSVNQLLEYFYQAQK